MLTTYRGPATNWDAPEFAATAHAAPDAYTGPMQRLALHQVTLFKGCGLPGKAEEKGIVHRSPPIVGSGITRLMLCLSPPQG